MYKIIIWFLFIFLVSSCSTWQNNDLSNVSNNTNNVVNGVDVEETENLKVLEEVKVESESKKNKVSEEGLDLSEKEAREALYTFLEWYNYCERDVIEKYSDYYEKLAELLWPSYEKEYADGTKDPCMTAHEVWEYKYEILSFKKLSNWTYIVYIKENEMGGVWAWSEVTYKIKKIDDQIKIFIEFSL